MVCQIRTYYKTSIYFITASHIMKRIRETERHVQYVWPERFLPFFSFLFSCAFSPTHLPHFLFAKRCKVGEREREGGSNRSSTSVLHYSLCPPYSVTKTLPIFAPFCVLTWRQNYALNPSSSLRSKKGEHLISHTLPPPPPQYSVQYSIVVKYYRLLFSFFTWHSSKESGQIKYQAGCSANLNKDACYNSCIRMEEEEGELEVSFQLLPLYVCAPQQPAGIYRRMQNKEVGRIQ